MSILFAWLLADFIAGIVHWAQDKLIVRETKYSFLNSIKKDNDIHHANPRHFLFYTITENISTSVIFAWPIAFALFFAGAPVIAWLTFFFVGFGNAIHRFSHSRKNELNWAI